MKFNLIKIINHTNDFQREKHEFRSGFQIGLFIANLFFCLNDHKALSAAFRQCYRFISIHLIFALTFLEKTKRRIQIAHWIIYIEKRQPDVLMLFYHKIILTKKFHITYFIYRNSIFIKHFDRCILLYFKAKQCRASNSAENRTAIIFFVQFAECVYTLYFGVGWDRESERDIFESVWWVKILKKEIINKGIHLTLMHYDKHLYVFLA